MAEEYSFAVRNVGEIGKRAEKNFCKGENVMSKCGKKQCAENRNGQCSIGLHPSWATCPENTEKSVAYYVQGSNFQAHVEAYEAYQSLGCYDPGGLEASKR